MDGHQFQPKDCEISMVCERMSCEESVLGFLTGGIELLWGKCTVFPDLGTEYTDRWRMNLHLCATCQYPLNRNWKNCAFAPKVIQLHLLRTLVHTLPLSIS
jgi:hypothetical protein